MAVKIRLMRFGKKRQPQYRIVVMDSKKPRNSTYLEKLGSYDPNQPKETISLDKERYTYWRKQGAQPSRGLERLLKSVN